MVEGKILYLVRHAKSSWAEPGQPDFDRPLNHRGEHNAPDMGRRLKARGIRPEIVLSSPARRAVQTTKALTAALGIPLETVIFDEKIYEASVGQLVEIIRAIEESIGSAMIIGHNPSITWLTNHLTGSSIANLPTCAVTTVGLSTNFWKNAGHAPSALVDFDFPKRQSPQDHCI